MLLDAKQHYWKVVCSTYRVGKSLGRKRSDESWAEFSLLFTWVGWLFSSGIVSCKAFIRTPVCSTPFTGHNSWLKSHGIFISLIRWKLHTGEGGLNKPPILQTASSCSCADRTIQHQQLRKFEKHHNQLMDFFHYRPTPKSWPLVQMGQLKC